MHNHRRKVLDRLLDLIRRSLNRALGRSQADKGIGRTSAAVLSLAVLSTGLTSYAYLRDALVHDRTSILEAELERRSQQLTSELHGGKQLARALAASMHAARALQVYQSDTVGVSERTTALMTLQMTAGHLVEAGGLRAVELRTLKGDRIATAGHLPALPEMGMTLSDGNDKLYWDGGFVLRTSFGMFGDDGVAGEMLADLRVQNADAAVSGIERLGETGQAALCGLSGGLKICFPSRFQPVGRVSKLATPATIPTDRALSGETGTLKLVDYRGEMTYSAFKPLDGHGLALVVKMDEAELLAPIWKQLILGIPVLVLLAAGGVFLIGRQLKPLTAELVDAKLRADLEIASRAAANAETSLAKRQLQLIADNAPFLISFLDPNFIFRFANRAHIQWFKRPLEEIIGMPMEALVGEMMSTHYRKEMVASFDTNLPRSYFRERILEGRSTFVEMTFVAQLDDAGRLEGYCVTGRDATENVLREQTLLMAARRDPLTGLCNRTSFNERLDQALHSMNEDEGLLVVAYLDIDYFKQVNDGFGHAVGDQLLTELGKRLQAILKPSDMVARLGGDEIGLLMQLEAPEEVHLVGSRLLESIREPFLIHGHIVHASASIGFAVAIPGDTMATLLKQADMALYEAKNRGRDGMFQAGMGRVPMHDLADTADRLYLV